jgi:hypothetical protein
MRQNVDAHHQTNRFAVAANRAVVNRQGFVQTLPVDQTTGAQKFMLRIENIRKKGLEHKNLPLRNICFHVNNLYHIRGKIKPFLNFLQFSKNQLSIYAVYKPHFSGRTT